MIVLTRLDGAPIGLNEDLLVFAEETPDTVLTMSSGQRLMVKETLEEVISAIAAFRQRARPLAVMTGAEHG
jgi:flagellar protein FlbD